MKPVNRNTVSFLLCKISEDDMILLMMKMIFLKRIYVQCSEN